MLFAYMEGTNLYWYNASSISSIYQYVQPQLLSYHWINSFQLKLPNELWSLNQVIWWSLCLYAPKRVIETNVEKNVFDLLGGSLVSFALCEQKNKMYSFTKCNISVQALSQYLLFYPEWWNVRSVPNGAFSEEVLLICFFHSVQAIWPGADTRRLFVVSHHQSQVRLR